jgi:hypothetical protein
MNPMEWLKTLYEAFGARHPSGSLAVVMVLGGLLGAAICGTLWLVGANQYQKSLVEPARSVNTTTGAQSPIMPNNSGSVTITDESDKTGHPQPKDKPK